MRATVVFDLDGTLVDSIGDIANAANRMLSEIGTDPLPLNVIQRFVGNGLPKLVERLMGHCDLPMEQHAEFTRIMQTQYNAAASETTRPYPGIPEALTQLRDMGCVLGVCTNKPEAPALHILKALDLTQHFDAVLGGDTLTTRKPDPAHLHSSFDALSDGGPRLFVGDSEVDAETSRRAQIPFLLFSGGYRKTPLEQIPHTVSYDAADELTALVTRMVKQMEQHV